MESINILGLSKAKVLAALYNNSKPQGLGFLHFKPEDMTEDEAKALTNTENLYFDYVNGRVIKVDLSNDAFSPALYDRDNGYGAAELAVNAIRK